LIVVRNDGDPVLRSRGESRMSSLPQQIESLQDDAAPGTSSDEPVHYGRETRTPISTVTIIDNAETLEELEHAIDSALAKPVLRYMVVGEALIKIHDRNMYGHSFERYVKERFGFSRSVLYDYINAATVGRALQLEGKPLPVSVRAALALLPGKTKEPEQAAEPAYSPPADAIPVLEDPSRPTPTLQATLMSLFRGVDVVINDSSTPGRWHLSLDVDDATTDQVRGIAAVLSGKRPTPELVHPALVKAKAEYQAGTLVPEVQACLESIFGADFFAGAMKTRLRMGSQVSNQTYHQEPGDEDDDAREVVIAPPPNRAPSPETDSINRLLTANADKLLALSEAAKVRK
jgi:hypothetical protein